MQNRFPITMANMLGTRAELVLVVSMVCILSVLFTPIPSGLLDFLLIVNFSFALLILLLTFYTDKPTNFSTFPTLLLIATLFRLSLNIAATRLILSDADAGHVIGAVGEFVVAGNYVIGLVVFLILIVVQYVVVTNGAQRVAEVAARFTLDSMPGKQMSIDADMNMGLIDEKEARQRRSDIEKEASFYGAMDGASKFVKGDAIAGIIIILINIIGGLTIGIAQHAMKWGDALHTYTLLTVGDGIVTQIPALVISTATGIIVTRAATDANLGDEIKWQITRFPKSLVIVSLGLLFVLMLPGIPAMPVLIILCVVLGLTYFAFKNHVAEEKDAEAKGDEKSDAESSIYDDLSVLPLELRIGSDLKEVVGNETGFFMEKLKVFRQHLADELGFAFPKVRLIDDKQLALTGYELQLFGARICQGKLFPNHYLAISATAIENDLGGVETTDPSYGLPAIWISKDKEVLAKSKGYTVVDETTVLFTHFSETIRKYLSELLTRAETEALLHRVKTSQPNLYEELIPNILTLSDIQKVLQLLLKEKVSIKNIGLIIESLVDAGKHTKDHYELVEQLRTKLARVVCSGFISDANELKVMSLEPMLEQSLHASLRVGDQGSQLLIDPALSERILHALARENDRMLNANLPSVLMVSAGLRRHIKRMTERLIPQLNVISLKEIPDNVNIRSFAIIRVEIPKAKFTMPEAASKEQARELKLSGEGYA